jgi:pyridinium-3,5-bisthiocarboxylic acid mononucleotide nickel chelatase
MRIAYLDCFAGIAGDMFLGALLDAGVPEQVLRNSTAALNIGAALKVEKVDRSGISSTKVHVLEGDRLAEDASPAIEQQTSNGFAPQPRTQHGHKTGHSHPQEYSEHHSHEHQHGRSLTEIRRLIKAAKLADPVKNKAIHTFELLGESEARIHNVAVENIHFHEVGAVDAIVDIVAACAGIHHLGIEAWYCSPINVGGGTVVCAHGTFPVPAPATADLLRGFPTYSAHIEKELVTPTGAALLRMLSPTFGPQPGMRVEKIGYGAGTRDPKNFPNVVRLSVGPAADVTSSAAQPLASGKSADVTVLETALDDMSPQLLAHVAERALAEGALDVMLTPVIMKKGRPGTLLTLLCDPGQASTFEKLVLRETTTLGVRIRSDRRSCLDRTHVTAATPYGTVRVKLGSLSGEILNVAPEFEDCRAAAAAHSVSVKQVQQAAIAAYISQPASKEPAR